MSTLPIVCLALGDFYGLGDQYVGRMYDMLARHCDRPFRLVCYTDRPRKLPAGVESVDCSGWRELDRPGMRATTRKLGLFNPAYVPFAEFLYLDLTLVIRGSMQPLLDVAFGSEKDLVIVDDWHHEGYNSSVMRIRPEPLRFIYDAFVAGESYAQKVAGDQDFIRAVVEKHSAQQRVELFPPGLVVSYKNAVRTGRRNPVTARAMVDGAVIVKFHGRPRMHEVFDPFHHFWRIRLRDLVHGRLRSPVPTAELKREWLGTDAS
ncbi:hypothetical protein M8A51_07885 [Schlegelella sp. S2-27]|uniref:Uncharacterized protein n=1 Tax=Caldimonas mangrovi TaxID=2944811 RepID=A0ABT0YL34_9BURK|nr:hypothetical protein [Caldimonas mangrovi]MCM5679448.1 hypothetical protein [Caldimonas mangrovi]